MPLVPRWSPTLILPPKYINDIKGLPSSVAAFEEPLFREHHGKYTNLGTADRTVISSVKIDLTRNISKTLSGVQDEADQCIPATIGECEEWTPLTLYPIVARIIAQISGRIFVGLPLCRNPQWLGLTLSYTREVFAAVWPITQLNPLLRPFLVERLPEMQAIRKSMKGGRDMLEPLVRMRMEATKDPDTDAEFNMIKPLLDNCNEKDRKDMVVQCRSQMTLAMAAIHTTAMNTTQALLDLCAYPEHIQPLREEIEEMMAADGGKFVKSNMTKLRKLDSFIKESQRLSPPGMSTCFPLQNPRTNTNRYR